MPRSPDEFVIFYAWQSDRAANGCRYLIQEALEEAKEELAKEKSFPFTITITSDTQGEPGLCDIPAVILDKIQEADAFVADLTFVAETDADPPKKCPIPNVLFELGNAFNAIGPERIIAVMNEKHGSTKEGIFDIAHRRRPIAYQHPTDGGSRNETKKALVRELKVALSGVLELGTRANLIDGQELYEQELRGIKKLWSSHRQTELNQPMAFFWIRPTSYQDRRYSSAPMALEILEESEVRSEGATIPFLHHHDRMLWGICNIKNTDIAWALTYSGMIWLAISISGHGTMRRSRHHEQIKRTLGIDPDSIGTGKWINFISSRIDIRDTFRFATSYLSHLPERQEIEWRFTCKGLEDTWLGSSDPRIPFDCSSPSPAPEIERKGRTSAKFFRDNWIDRCSESLGELYGLYDERGRRYDEPDVKEWLEDWQANSNYA